MKTNIIGLKELRENMEKYISEVEKGRSFVVVKKSKPAFKMVPVDEWGDEGVWKTLVDFTQIDPKGVHIDEVLASLKRLDAQN
ncbi:MAG: type II toxin-antitoxin system prevent-host-death family antitoxin [Patescibacteria group bacterium]